MGFSIASWSLLSPTQQNVLSNATDGLLLNVTVTGENGRTWNWQVLRDVINWGIWKVFGQVAEPYDNAVSGTSPIVLIVALGNDKYVHLLFRK